MRKAVKRLFCVVLSAALVCQLCSGCTANKPEQTVKQFCKAMQLMDFAEMSRLAAGINPELAGRLSDLAEHLTDSFDAFAEQYPIMDLFQLCARKIHTQVTSNSGRESGSTEISVNFSYPDLYALFEEYRKEYGLSFGGMVSQALTDARDALENLFSDSPSESKNSRSTAPELLDWTIQQLRKGDVSYREMTVTFECKRTDDDRWGISSVPVDLLLEILTFGLTL